LKNCHSHKLFSFNLFHFIIRTKSIYTMKVIIPLALLMLFCVFKAHTQNIGIGTTTPHESAQLDVTAANKGILIPRMLLTNRPASPATGLLIYQTDNNPGFYFFDGSDWIALRTSPFSLPYSGSISSDTAFRIYNAGGVAISGLTNAGPIAPAGNFQSIHPNGLALRAEAPLVGGSFFATGQNGTGISATSLATNGEGDGGYFVSHASNGNGIQAYAVNSTGLNKGIYAVSTSNQGIGIWGAASNPSGATIGIFAENKSSSGVALKAGATSITGTTIGVEGSASSALGTGVYGISYANAGINYGVTGLAYSPSGFGGYFRNLSAGSGVALGTGPGLVEFATLSGTGTRMVVANETGRLGTQVIPVSPWTTSGNNIYNSNFGNVGIGTSNPLTTLDIAGQIRITGGSPGLGKVLTSDANGLASWQSLTTGGNNHNHLGQSWNSQQFEIGLDIGNYSLGSNTVGLRAQTGFGTNSIALRGEAANNTGIGVFGWAGESNIPPSLQRNSGVAGYSQNGSGIFGTSENGIAIHGRKSNSPNPMSGPVALFENYKVTNPDPVVKIVGAGGQPTLELNNGFIKVAGTNKTAFVVTGDGSNTSGHILTLNYTEPLPNDIVIITLNTNPPGGGSFILNVPVGVNWNGTKWTIISQDLGTSLVGKSFNVLVIKQ
jgi:hypothetical protein